MILLQEIHDGDWFEYGDYVYARVVSTERGIKCYNTNRGRMEYLPENIEVRKHVRYR